jgi:hypothetical protein
MLQERGTRVDINIRKERKEIRYDLRGGRNRRLETKLG